MLDDAQRADLREEIAKAIDPDAFADCCGQHHDLWAEEALRAADAVLALPSLVALLAESEHTCHVCHLPQGHHSEICSVGRCPGVLALLPESEPVPTRAQLMQLAYDLRVRGQRRRKKLGDKPGALEALWAYENASDAVLALFADPEAAKAPVSVPEVTDETSRWPLHAQMAATACALKAGGLLTPMLRAAAIAMLEDGAKRLARLEKVTDETREAR